MPDIEKGELLRQLGYASDHEVLLAHLETAGLANARRARIAFQGSKSPCLRGCAGLHQGLHLRRLPKVGPGLAQRGPWSALRPSVFYDSWG